MTTTCQRLETIRLWELLTAAGLPGVSSVSVADYRDDGAHASQSQARSRGERA